MLIGVVQCAGYVTMGAILLALGTPSAFTSTPGLSADDLMRSGCYGRGLLTPEARHSPLLQPRVDLMGVVAPPPYALPLALAS